MIESNLQHHHIDYVIEFGMMSVSFRILFVMKERLLFFSFYLIFEPIAITLIKFSLLLELR